ncbi:MAG: LysR family transcriptional regulator [Acholeplasmataceae bacterium]
MTLLQIKYFITVCESGSLTAASKSLFVTQPALSNAINQLEKEYNLKLFERKNHGLILTAEGEFFYDKAKSLLNGFDVLDKDLRDLSQHQYTIRIGVPPMIGSFLFPKIYNQYMATHPDAKFEIWEEGSLSIRKKIQSKTLDIGFSILNDSANEHYEKEHILETELLYCVNKDNPISKKTSLTIEDIKDESIILLREGFFQNQLINQMYMEVHQDPKIILVSTQLSVIRNFVKMNAGGAFLMKELVDINDDDIVGVPFKNKLTLRIGLIWQKEAQLHKGALEFITFLRDGH